MDLEREVRRLKCWNALFLGLLASGLVGFEAWWRLSPALGRVQVEVRGDLLHIIHLSDGPFVVTHVVGRTTDHTKRRVAALDPPLAFLESGSTDIETKNLTWQNDQGKPAAAPSVDFEALYFIPEKAY